MAEEQKAAGSKVPEDIQRALKSIVEQISQESMMDYRRAIRKAARGRAYWKGLHYGWFSESQNAWVATSPVTQQVKGGDEDEDPRFEFVLNMYQATVMVIIAALAANGVPPTAFLPVDPNNPQDVSTSRCAADIREFIYRAQSGEDLQSWVRLNWLLCTDGVVLGYARHLRDGQRYGFDEQPNVAMQDAELRPAGYECKSCGAFSTEQSNLFGVCPECGEPLTPDTMKPAITASMPVTLGTRKVPKGTEKLDLFGILETRLPAYCCTLKECPWVGIEIEVEVSSARAAHPELAEKIVPGYGTLEGDGYGFRAREMSNTPADSPSRGQIDGGAARQGFQSMVTYGRWWLRPERYYTLLDKRESEGGKTIVQRLQEMFPDGVRVEMYGDTFVDATNERMDEHLDLCHATTGDGMFTPALCESYLDINDLANTGINLHAEAQEYAAFAPVFYKSNKISEEAINKRMRPAQYTPIHLDPGESIAGNVLQIEVKESSAAVDKTLSMATSLAPMLTGAEPVLAGATDVNIKTASGQSQARSQALQRLGIPYQQAKRFWAQMDLLRVKEFVRFRTEDQISFPVPAGRRDVDYQVKTIKMASAQGSVSAYAEATDTIPTTIDARRKAIEMLMGTANPAIQQWMADPMNLELLAELFAIPDLSVPGRDERNAVLITIQELLKEVPQPDPQGGQPAASRQPDSYLDDLGMVAQVVKEWARSPQGQAAASNPATQQGYQNVILYGRAAQNALQQQQQQAQQQQLQQTVQAHVQRDVAAEQGKVQPKIAVNAAKEDAHAKAQVQEHAGKKAVDHQAHVAAMAAVAGSAPGPELAQQVL